MKMASAILMLAAFAQSALSDGSTPSKARALASPATTQRIL